MDRLEACPTILYYPPIPSVTGTKLWGTAVPSLNKTAWRFMKPGDRSLHRLLCALQPICGACRLPASATRPSVPGSWFSRRI